MRTRRRRRGAGHDVHRPRRRHRGHQRSPRHPEERSRPRRPLHIDAASGGFVAVPVPDTEWDFRLEQVRSIDTSGHKYGLATGIGWLVFKETTDLAEDLVFYENYLGKRDATFTLNFSTSSAMVLAQYYNFVRLGHEGYRYTMETMQANTRRWQSASSASATSSWSATRARNSFRSSRSNSPRSGIRRVRRRLAARRRARLDGPAYTLPPNTEHVTIMRALVKLTLGHTLGSTLADDLAQACATLEQKAACTAQPQAAKNGTGSPSEAPFLDRVELGLRDGAAVEQLVGLRRSRWRGRRTLRRSSRSRRIGALGLDLPHLALGHPVAVGDQVDQHAQERQHDHEHAPRCLAHPRCHAG